MKTIDLSSVPVDTIWFSQQFDKTLTEFTGNYDQLIDLCKEIQQQARTLFKKQESQTARGASDLNYENKISKTGTASDKVALSVLRIRRCSLVFSEEMFNLLSQMFKHKRSVSLTAPALYEILELVLPQSRCLVPLKMRFGVKNGKLQVYSSKLSILYAYFEDQVAQFIQQLSELIATHLTRDPIPHLRETGLEIMGELLNYPTTEKMALKLVVERFSDADRKITQKAARMLGDGVKRSGQLLVNITAEIIGTIQLTAIECYKPTDTGLLLSTEQREKLEDDKRKLKALLTFIKQHVADKELPAKLFADLADLYFGLINQQLDLEQKHVLPSVKKLKQQQLSKKGKGTKDKKKQNETTVDRTAAEEFGLIKLLVTSLSAILPKADFSLVGNLQEHIIQISKLCKSVNFNLSVQMNELLLRVLSVINATNSQKINAEVAKQLSNVILESIYYSAFRFDFQYVSEHAGFYTYLYNVINLHTVVTNNLLFKKEVFAAFWKKLLQCGVYNFNPAFQSNFLLTLQTAAINNQRTINGLQQSKMYVAQPSECLPFGSPFSFAESQKQFQQFQTKPEESNAVNDQLWEVLLLKRSYHPSQRLFAEQLLDDKFVVTADLKELFPKSAQSPHQPFNLNDVSGFLGGEKSMLVYENDVYFNQIHLNQLNRSLQNAVHKPKQEKITDIDQIIIRDLMKKGVLASDAPFQEVAKILDNDKEYMKRYQAQAEEGMLDAAKLRMMDFGDEMENEEGEFEEEGDIEDESSLSESSSSNEIVTKEQFKHKQEAINQAAPKKPQDKPQAKPSLLKVLEKRVK